MTNIQDLLNQYADTCTTIGAGLAAQKVCALAGYDEQTIKSVFRLTEAQKATLESQIIKLFEEVKKEGAQVERAECIKIVDRLRPYGGHKCEDPENAAICVVCRPIEHLIKAIRERGNQSEQAEGGETK